MTHSLIKRTLEAAAKVAEAPIAEMEQEQENWRNAWQDAARPYEDEIACRKDIAAAIRAIDPASIAEGVAAADDSLVAQSALYLSEHGWDVAGDQDAAENAVREVIKAALRSATIAPDDGWNHDMSAAPRDGSDLLYYTKGGDIGVCYWSSGAWFDPKSERTPYPTAWCHMPEPPRGK